MKIAIVGWGIEGQSAYKYFGPEHSYLIVNEEPRNDFPAESERVKIQYLNAQKPVGLTSNVQDLSYLDGIESCDKIVYTPTAIKNLEKRFDNDKGFWGKTTTTRHIFFEKVNTNNIIGVTGTKGKGTTSTLIYQILQAAGKRAFLGGNIGRGVLDFVNEVQPEDWVVLELSSFQLYRFHYSPHIGVCLMITPEHLDWHLDMREYIESKSNLFRWQQQNDIAVYFAKNQYSSQLAFTSPGTKIPYYDTPGARLREDGMIIVGEQGTEVLHKDQVKLLGAHNLQNICAALTAAWQITQDVEAIRKVLTTFTGLEHRLELVRELDGIKYYNDSFATGVGATMAAIAAIPQKKVLIVGGFDRQLPLEEFAKIISGHSQDLRKVVLIGQSADRVAQQLRDVGFDNFLVSRDKDISSIVRQAQGLAQQGDAVVLSPGFASFGMFKNFEDRGQQYKLAVNNL